MTAQFRAIGDYRRGILNKATGEETNCFLPGRFITPLESPARSAILPVSASIFLLKLTKANIDGSRVDRYNVLHRTV